MAPSVITLGLARAGTKHTSRANEPGQNKFKARSAMTQLMCGIYCMMTCVFGAVFPISDALAQTTEGHHLYYTEVFHCYMYGLGVIAYIYFLLLIVMQRRMLRASGKLEDIELDVIAGMQSVSATRRRGGCDFSDQRSEMAAAARLLAERELKQAHDKEMEDLEKEANVTYEAEGVNFYLRLGAMGFGVGGMVQSGFRISEPFENPYAMNCRSILFLLNAALYLVFVFLQTFFIFKYHKVVVHKHKAFVRFCLMHILAANLSVWLSTTTHETAEDIGRMSAKSVSGTQAAFMNYTTAGAKLWRYEQVGMNSSATNLSLDISDQDTGNVNHINDMLKCHQSQTLSDRSAPYLFPCLIEYSLIGAAVAYRTFLNVGKTVAKDDSNDSDKDAVQFSEPVECHKSNRGLFLGLLMILVTFVSVALFYVFEEDNRKDVSATIFLSSELFLFAISIISCIIGMCYTRRLAYVGLLDEDFFDDKLLLIAQIGIFLLCTCVSISSATALVQNIDNGIMTLPAMYLGMALFNFIQSSIQTVFILDGLRRCAATNDHMTQKPGRAVITFLLVCNLAMWTVNTFETKSAEVVDIHVDFFRYLPWSIIMHLCFPLVIFYRFHSSVCLSAIWHTAYVKRNIEDYGQQINSVVPAIRLEECPQGSESGCSTPPYRGRKQATYLSLDAA
ncbi:proton channel OtopLc-like [Lineus longissimus]|uniref:proton channel OtopLc-like n=1 Tax=Lineus longissimus TaxID=88925 RepID=UPI002B4C4A59